VEPPDDDALEANRRLTELVSAEASAIIATLAGLMLAGPPGALIGAGAGVMVQRVVNEVMGRRFQRATTAIEIAADESGLPPERLLERVLADERLLELAAAVIAAAAETALKAKILMVGQALARGTLAADDATIDQERFLVEMLADLEAPHFHVLQQVSEYYDGYGEPTTPNGTPRAYGWTRDALSEWLPGLAPVVGPVLATLGAHDLISNTAVGSLGYRPGIGDRWVLTPHGDDLLRRLQNAVEEDPDPPGV
jgi:hypothetical protein